MSWTFLINTEKRIDFKEVYEKFRYDRPIDAIEQSDRLFYFYGSGSSTRGIDVSLEKHGYEIRIPVMSNRIDLSIALRLIQIISEMTGGKVYHEDQTELIGPDYLTEEFIKNSFINDMKTIFLLIREMGSIIEFPGPTRSVFIGKKILGENLNYEKRIKTTANNIESIFLEVLYKLPDWTEPSIIAVGSNEGDRFIKLKLVTSDNNYIVQNYDYIIIGGTEESKHNDMIFIDQKNLEPIMPEYWYFVDESTIVAEKMPLEEWHAFRDECRKLNCYHDFRKKAN
ncbi:MAG: DUF4299 domain-containing protein [Spirochaetales bacterium]|jgi:hypothetical protein|nr:DUF4299 domain-containing protein [Spirochaetales bacterium]